jgi:hypothetical protein
MVIDPPYGLCQSIVPRSFDPIALAMVILPTFGKRRLRSVLAATVESTGTRIRIRRDD